MLDERALSERLGVSRTPIREAIAMLEQDGFVKTVHAVASSSCAAPRRDRRHDPGWAALESMAARLITTTAHKKDISACATSSGISARSPAAGSHRGIFEGNIAFHQALISLSESPVLVDMTNDILLHVRGYRQLTIDASTASRPPARTYVDHRSARSARHRACGKARARSHARACRLCGSPRPGTVLADRNLSLWTEKAECPRRYRASMQIRPKHRGS